MLRLLDVVINLSKIWVWDPGSVIQDPGVRNPEKTYSGSDPGSRLQGQKGTGSRVRIRNTGRPLLTCATYVSSYQLIKQFLNLNLHSTILYIVQNHYIRYILYVMTKSFLPTRPIYFVSCRLYPFPPATTAAFGSYLSYF
jgi:hypothetical protein